MDEALALPEHKIQLPEFIFIGCLLVLVSLVNLIPLVGDATSVIAGAGMFFYLYHKKLWGTSVIATNAVGYLCGLIPVVQEFPTALVAWVITFIIDRNQKLEALTEKVGSIEGGGEGGLGAASEAEGAAAAGAKAGTAATAGVEGAEGSVGTATGTGGTPKQGGGERGGPQESGRHGEAPTGSDAGTSRAEGGSSEEWERGEEETRREEISPEEIGQRPETMEELQQRLVGETPVGAEPAAGKTPEEEAPPPRESRADQKFREGQERAQKLAERMKRMRPQEQEGGGGKEPGGGEGEEEDEMDMAA